MLFLSKQVEGDDACDGSGERGSLDLLVHRLRLRHGRLGLHAHHHPRGKLI